MTSEAQKRYNETFRLKHPERLKAYVDKYKASKKGQAQTQLHYWTHKSEILARAKRWYEKNKPEILTERRLKFKKWYSSHKEEEAVRKHLWYLKNKKRLLVTHRLYRQKKKEVI